MPIENVTSAVVGAQVVVVHECPGTEAGFDEIIKDMRTDSA